MIRSILGLCALLAVGAVAAQDAPEHKHHQPQAAPPPATAPMHQHMDHGGAPAAGGEHQHHHGMVAPESRDFPTIAYNETRTARAPQTMAPPTAPGHAHRGKQLAFSAEKGRCLSCHVLGPDGEQPGTVGPNLSEYARRGVSPAQTFQKIWDARVSNPHSVMPAFGTNTLLTAEEVADITAYLHKLDTPVAAPAPMTQDTRGVWIVGEDLTRADDVIDEGKQLFQRPGSNGKSCAGCHAPGGTGPDLKTAAATYPKWNAQRKRVIVLEQRINMCRMQHMDSEHDPLGSRESNVLTSYVKYLARRTPLNVATDGEAQEAIARGKASFYRRAGQLNFSCATCHAPEQPVAGRWMRGDVTQAMTDGGGHRTIAAQWPKHFIGGHDLGLQSLQQRIEHCQAVTRVLPLLLGSPEYVDLELYLTSLGNGSPLLAPTMTKLRGE